MGIRAPTSAWRPRPQAHRLRAGDQRSSPVGQRLGARRGKRCTSSDAIHTSRRVALDLRRARVHPQHDCSTWAAAGTLARALRGDMMFEFSASIRAPRAGWLMLTLTGLLLHSGPGAVCNALHYADGQRLGGPWGRSRAADVNSLQALRHDMLRRNRAVLDTLRLRGGSEFMSSATLLAQNPEMAQSLMSSKLMSKTRKYGFIVLALGLLLSTLGFMLFFNRTLIGTGNLLTIGGVVLISGHQRAYAFLAQRERARGSGIFLFGVFLVLRGSARLGVLVNSCEPPAATLLARLNATCADILRAGRSNCLGSSTSLATSSPPSSASSKASPSSGQR